MFTAGYNSRQREVDELREEVGAWVHRQAELQAQVALQERRFREAETEWVERYERLDAEVERLKEANTMLAEEREAWKARAQHEEERWREVVTTFSAGNVALEAEVRRLRELHDRHCAFKNCQQRTTSYTSIAWQT
jgi:DNA repair exonuclease SbcCD ATPase subunit